MDSGRTGYFTIFYVTEQAVLLNVFDELGHDIVVEGQQGAVLNEKTATANCEDHAVKKEEGFLAEDVSLSTCKREIAFLLVPLVLFFLDQNCTRALLARLAESAPESSTVLPIGRRWKPSAK